MMSARVGSALVAGITSDATERVSVARATQRSDATPHALVRAHARDRGFLAGLFDALRDVAPELVGSPALDMSSASGLAEGAGPDLGIWELASELRNQVPPDQTLWRLSITYQDPTLSEVRAHLRSAAELAERSGFSFAGAIDVSRRTGHWHLYVLLAAPSRTDARAIAQAAVSGAQVRITPVGYGHGATPEDDHRVVAYMLAPWPLSAGVRDPVLDIAVAGRFSAVWEAHRASVAPAPGPRCIHCSAPLPAGSTRRRTYCGRRCRQAAHRRRHATQPAHDDVPSQSTTQSDDAHVPSLGPTGATQTDDVRVPSQGVETFLFGRDRARDALVFASELEGPDAPAEVIAATAGLDLLIELPTGGRPRHVAGAGFGEWPAKGALRPGAMIR